MAGLTLYEKIWAEHVVIAPKDEATLLYIDLHLVHEVTSPQAFDGLRMNARTVRRPDLTLATLTITCRPTPSRHRSLIQSHDVNSRCSVRTVTNTASRSFLADTRTKESCTSSV